jgi:enolase
LISDILIRRILNSNGGFAYEAEIQLDNKYNGIGAAPSAIMIGRREKKITSKIFPQELVYQLIGCDVDQESLDSYLDNNIQSLGSDITLAISMAFARAMSNCKDISLVDYLKNICPNKQNDRQIAPIIPIFSGGIHDPELGGSMQQIMLKIENMDFQNSVEVICLIYNQVENILTKKGMKKGIAASSGFLVHGMSIEEEFEFINDLITNSPWEKNLSIAVDVAAEHLRTQDGYMFYNKMYQPDEFESLLLAYIDKYRITYLEDPFDCNDISNWKSLHEKINTKTEIIADDYSATQLCYLEKNIADGFIIKMKQVGTVIETLKMVSQVKKLGLKTCVSHRSSETEDTFICDLAIAIDSDYMKIGAPRRGDRVEKYNRLIRLYNINL